MDQQTTNITDVFRKPRKCPHCGGKVVPIIYGEPRNEVFEKADRGEVVLGGCGITAHMPQWQCTGCGHQFIRVILIRDAKIPNE